MEAAQCFKSFFDFFCHHRIIQEAETDPFKQNSKRHKLFIVKSVLILVACILLGIYGKSFEDAFIPNRSCINRMINWVCLGAMLMTCFIVAWETMVASREDVKIWNTFETIENALRLCNQNPDETLRKYQRVYKIIFFTYFALLCLIGAILVIEFKDMDGPLVDFIVIFELLSIVDVNRVLQIVMYVRILTCYIHHLKEAVRNAVLSVSMGNDPDGPNLEPIQTQLRKSSACYFLCIKAFRLIQDQFAWGLFVVCLKFSIILWNEIYWTVYRAIMETSYELYCLNVVPYHFVYFSFTWSCECLTAEITWLSQLLYELDLNKASTYIKMRITQLMLLLEYKVFFFHTFGVCRVSYHLIVQYAISGATKVSFIAQLMIDFYNEMK
uniref:Gustatory receptor n=1 Tax=Anopheles dirus TaxID=7168 RepID=A0A182NYZ9_9DIPT